MISLISKIKRCDQTQALCDLESRKHLYMLENLRENRQIFGFPAFGNKIVKIISFSEESLILCFYWYVPTLPIWPPPTYSHSSLCSAATNPLAPYSSPAGTTEPPPLGHSMVVSKDRMVFVFWGSAWTGRCCAFPPCKSSTLKTTPIFIFSKAFRTSCPT